MSTPSFPTPQQPQWQPMPTFQSAAAPRDKAARRLGAAGLVVGAIGIGIGLWGVFWAPKESVESSTETTATEVADPSFTSEEVAAAKAQVCEAHELASTSVTYAFNPPDPGDDAGLNAGYAALAQLSLVAAADYVELQLAPATPTDLREAVLVLIDQWRLTAVEAVGGGKAATYEQDVLEANVASEEVRNLCR